MVRDINKTDRLLKIIDDLTSESVEIGILGSDKKRGTSILLIANVHEFGSEAHNIPERSFIRATYDEQVKKYMDLGQKYVTKAINGKLRPRTMYNLLGQKASQDIQKRIKAFIPPPLKPETIKRKGSDLPLVDTGRLIGAVSYKVKK